MVNILLAHSPLLLANNLQADSTRTTTTTRPLHLENTCPFSFSIYWDETCSRWYFLEEGPGSKVHKGHYKKEADEVRQLTKDVGENELQLAADLLSQNIDPMTVRAFVQKRTGQLLNANQIRAFRVKLSDATIVDGETTAGVGRRTPADKLLKALEEDPETSFIALFGDFDSNLLSTPKLRLKRKQRGKGAVEKTFDTHTAGPVPITVVEDVPLGDAVESPLSFAQNIRNALAISGSTKILLAVAWTNNEAQRLAEMFPEVTSSDITEKTNAEKRAMMMDVGVTSENKTFVSTWAFFPSKCRWIFDWYTAIAKPALHSKRTIQMNKLNLTDEDELEFGAYISHSGPGELYEEGQSRLCAWHKVDRNFTSTQRSTTSSLHAIGLNEFDVVVEWLYFFTDSIESEEECLESMRLLEFYCSENERKWPRALRVAISDFIATKFKPRLPMLAHYHFMRRMNFALRVTSYSESENSVMKRSSIGPKPNMPIDRSQAAVANLNSIRSRQKRMAAAASLDQVAVAESDRIFRISELVDFANDRLFQQFRARVNYGTFQEVHTTRFAALAERCLGHVPKPFVVKAVFYVKLQVFARRRKYDSTDKLFYRSVLPRFWRTRVVFLLEYKGHLILICSCCHFEQHGRPCRHIFCVNPQQPTKEDVHVRNWKLYLSHYGKDKQLTDLFNSLRDNFLPGPRCGTAGLNPLGLRTDRAFFEATLGKVVLRTKGTYWDTTSSRQEFVHQAKDAGMSLTAVHPFGLEQVVHLSEKAQAEAEGMSFEIDEPPLDGNDGEALDDDDDYDEDAAALFEQVKKKGAYVTFHGKYQAICDNVNSPEAAEALRLNFDIMQTKLQGMSFAASGQTATAGTLSLPNTDKSQQGHRNRKVSSPPRKKSRTASI